MKTLTHAPSKGLVHYLFIAMILMFGVLAISLSTAPAALASCAKGQLCDGAGNSPAPLPGGGTPAPGAPPVDDGGMTGPVDPYAFSIWNPDGGHGVCGNRDDGKAAYGYYTYFTTLHVNNDSNIPPDDSGWTYLGFIRAGSHGFHAWEKMIMTGGPDCVYPPRTRIDTVPCYISTTIQLKQLAPANRVVANKTRNSGYTAGSTNYDACVNSNSRVSFGSGLDEYGYYSIGNSSWIQNVTVEVALGVDPMLGYVPAPKIVGWAPAYTTGFRESSTASLHCSTGFESPGVWHADWTDKPCINISYVCPTYDPQIDVSEGTSSSMKSFKGSLEMMRDGKTRELRFGLGNIHGSNLTVHTQKTRFLRAGTPWDNSKTSNNNLFELNTRDTKGSLLTYNSGTATGWQNGKINSVFTRGYYASEYSAPTTVTQEVFWTGTVQVRSGTINSVDPVTGGIDYTPRYIAVPTSGLCSQTASLNYVRAIGHESGA